MSKLKADSNRLSSLKVCNRRKAWVLKSLNRLLEGVPSNDGSDFEELTKVEPEKSVGFIK